MNVSITKESFFDRLTQFIKEKNYPRFPYDIWKKLYDLIEDKDLEISKTYSALYTISASCGTYLARKIVTISEQSVGEAISISNKNHICSNVLYAFCNMLETQNIYAELKWTLEDINTNINNERKEEKEMKGFNIEFGSCEKDNVRLSMYGLAVKNANNEWVSYDAKNDTIINVDIFNFEGGKYLYKMPVALGDIKPGDLLIHNRKPVFVTDVTAGIKAVDIAAGEKKEVMLTRNMFNFEYATKVVSLLDFMGGAAATKEQPFGNMLPFLMLEQGGDTSDLMPLMLMRGNMDLSNPMMLYFLMKDKSDNMLPLFFMMNANNGCNKKD